MLTLSIVSALHLHEVLSLAGAFELNPCLLAAQCLDDRLRAPNAIGYACSIERAPILLSFNL